MLNLKLIRLVYVCEFLVACIAVFTAWSEIGGQAALDLMNWSWKFGLGLTLAASIVCYSAALVGDSPLWTPRSLRWLGAILLLVLAMGGVTYFYSLQVDAGDSDEGNPPSVHHAISSSFKELRRTTDSRCAPKSAEVARLVWWRGIAACAAFTELRRTTDSATWERAQGRRTAVRCAPKSTEVAPHWNLRLAEGRGLISFGGAGSRPVRF